MDKDHELTDKVDALLSKHGFGHMPSNGLGNTPSSRDTALDDRNIPVLTEVISVTRPRGMQRPLHGPPTLSSN